VAHSRIQECRCVSDDHCMLRTAAQAVSCWELLVLVAYAHLSGKELYPGLPVLTIELWQPLMASESPL